MKTPILLGALLVCAAPLCAQPADSASKLVNDLPFPLVSPERAQELAVAQPIVIDLDNVTLKTALEALQKQSGVRFGMNQGISDAQLETKLSIHLNTPSFDRAFAEIMDEAGINARLRDWGNDLQLTQGTKEPEDNSRKTRLGFFDITLSQLSSNSVKSIDLSDFDKPKFSEEHRFGATLGLRPDRRLQVVGAPMVRLTRAEDDQGRSLAPDPVGNAGEGERMNSFSFYGNSMWQQNQVAVNLRPHLPDAKTVAHLEGVVIYALVTKTESWEVADLLSAPEWTRSMESGGETVAFKIEGKLNTEDETGGLKVKIEVNASSDDNSHQRITYPLRQLEVLMAAMRIEDSRGVTLRQQGYSATGGKNAVIRATFNRENWYAPQENTPPLQGPFKFSLVAPVEVVQTEVPFAFADVPLP